MRPIGKYIVIKKINEEVRTSSGFLLSQKDTEEFRYQKGKVIKPGTEVEHIHDDDEIYYDKAAGHSMFLGQESYTVIRERDVVVVL